MSRRSADERFDASFHTNILVNSSGYCQYLPPGNTPPATSHQPRPHPARLTGANKKEHQHTVGAFSRTDDVTVGLQDMKKNVNTHIRRTRL